MLVSIWDELIPGRLIAADPITVDAERITVRDLFKARAAQHGFANPPCIVWIDGRLVDLDEPVVLCEESDVRFLRKAPSVAGQIRHTTAA